ncbi:major facilitator superfamily domain-containing protein [Lipomyces oligophaga]|uniref:major facilitator superfamily domain-containing protein n=1 Tax=Lipomyces oligophaga TaxID=45792 RepID=UPI0034CD80C2
MFDRRTARYVSIIADFWVSLGSGSHYVYSAYGPQLAARLGFTATESSVIATLGSVGVYFSGPPAGIVIDKKPPHIPILIGGCLILFGYMMMRYAFVSELRSVAFVGIFMIVASSGNTFAYHACVKCAAVNFPNRRGTATSIPVAGYGLSALFFSQIGNAAFPGDTGRFMLMLPLLASGLVFLGVPFVRHIPVDKILDTEVAVAPESIASIETEGLLQPSMTTLSSSSSTEKIAEKNYQSISEFEQDLGSSVASADDENASMVDEVVLPEGTDEIDIHGWALFRDWRFWTHFSIHGLLSGCGLMYILSAGYVLRALFTYRNPFISPADLQKNQAIQVSLVSSFSFIGRIIAGFTADKLKKNGYQRMWVILASSILFMFAQIGGLTITSSRFMWFISVCNGAAYGALFGSYASIISEIFGLKRFSENYGYLTVATVAGSDIFAFAFGAIYDGNSYFIDETQYMYSPTQSFNETSPYYGETSYSYYDEFTNTTVRRFGSQVGQVCEYGLDCYRKAFAITLPGSILAACLALFVIRYENLKSRRLAAEAEEKHITPHEHIITEQEAEEEIVVEADAI